jgi:hypothetical protein
MDDNGRAVLQPESTINTKYKSRFELLTYVLVNRHEVANEEAIVMRSANDKSKSCLVAFFLYTKISKHVLQSLALGQTTGLLWKVYEADLHLIVTRLCKS